MAEDRARASGAGRQLLLQKVYIKDLSFESPRAPAVFRADSQPKTELNIKSTGREIATDTQEVTLTLTVEAKEEDTTLFLIELQQAGVFLIRGYSNEERSMLIGSFCPATLYPFAREAVADLVVKGGFPSLLLQPINFDALYHQALRERGKDNNAPSPPGSGETH